MFVTGEVQKPGRYPLKAERTLLGLLGDIGPLGQNVGHEVIVIRPPGWRAQRAGQPSRQARRIRPSPPAQHRRG